MFLIPEVEVKVTKRQGRGIFATADIPAGTVIGDYLGMIVRPEDEGTEGEHFYSMYYSDKATIEPDADLPGIHLLNHSCVANCGMYTYKRRCLYGALRKIHKGEELTIHYALPAPNEEDCDPCEHECHCGAPLCTGTMHLADEYYQKWVKYVEKGETGPEIPESGYNKPLPPLEKYPELLPDATIFNVYANLKSKPKKIDTVILPTAKELRKLLREGGTRLAFPKLKFIIEGIVYDRIIGTRA